MQTAKKIIYDVGANTGQDIPYYLEKADLVVAVEPNPPLAREIATKFADAVSADKLVIEASILTADAGPGDTPFYIHRERHVLSQFPRPDEHRLGEYDVVSLPSTNIVDMVRRHGSPYYVKIDVEFYDGPLLRALFESGIRPPYISAESHSVDVFALLVALGRYESFNLINAATVAQDYRHHTIKTATGMKPYSFPSESAGPFGEDIKGPWMTPDNFFRRLAFAGLEGLGWKDIHATTEIAPDPSASKRLRSFFLEVATKRLRQAAAGG